MMLHRLLLMLCVLLPIAACSEKDGSEIPYGLNGYEAWVFDRATSTPHRAGRFESNYLDREKGLSQCRDAAFAYARENRIYEWDFICCTMTHSSNCASKVR